MVVERRLPVEQVAFLDPPQHLAERSVFLECFLAAVTPGGIVLTAQAFSFPGLKVVAGLVVGLVVEAAVTDPQTEFLLEEAVAAVVVRHMQIQMWWWT